MAAARKSSSGAAGGGLLFLGSLVYLYVLFTWYNSTGGAVSSSQAWLTMASFLAPFVLAGALVAAITLFFWGLGSLAGKTSTGDMTKVLWKFVNMAGLTALIVTGGTAWFYWAVVGFLLSFIGAMMSTM